MFKRVPEHRIREIFLETKQEDLKLEAALAGYFADTALCAEDERAAYLAYIKRRIRPAAMLLARTAHRDALAALAGDGILTRETLMQTAGALADGKDPAAYLTVMAAMHTRGERGSSPEEGPGDAARCLELIRRQVYALFTNMDAAMAALKAAEHPLTPTMGTDGSFLWYNPRYVPERYEADRPGLARQYLHILLHCVFGHWKLRGRLREEADETIEDMIEAECARSRAVREALGPRVPSAPGDDHTLWPRDEGTRREKERDEAWSLIGALCGAGPGGQGRAGGGIGADRGEGSLFAGQIRPGEHDYRNLLRRFAVMQEEMITDMDSFDYIWYTLGLERLGDLPLIEPLEYTEGHALEELVIAIDTSMSCSDETVRRFLEDSCAILVRRENFFDRMNVYVIQCDCAVQQVLHIRSVREWRACAENMTVSGRGGTDFGPVFRYVDGLRRGGGAAGLKVPDLFYRRRRDFPDGCAGL